MFKSNRFNAICRSHIHYQNDKYDSTTKQIHNKIGEYLGMPNKYDIVCKHNKHLDKRLVS